MLTSYLWPPFLSFFLKICHSDSRKLMLGVTQAQVPLPREALYLNRLIRRIGMQQMNYKVQFILHRKYIFSFSFSVLPLPNMMMHEGTKGGNLCPKQSPLKWT